MYETEKLIRFLSLNCLCVQLTSITCHVTVDFQRVLVFLKVDPILPIPYGVHELPRSWKLEPFLATKVINQDSASVDKTIQRPLRDEFLLRSKNNTKMMQHNTVQK